MSIDVENSLMDHEARYEYLSQLDEAWELCRIDVEHARSSYEAALESSRGSYEERSAAATGEHRRLADDAWASYRRDVHSSGSENRREAIAEARRKFNDIVAMNRSAYRQAMSRVREEYSIALRAARADYEHAVEDTFGHHRAAVEMVHHYLEPADDQSSECVASQAMAVLAEDARHSGPAPEAPLRADPHPATGVCHPGIGGGMKDDEGSFVDWLSGNGATDHGGAAA